MIKDLLLVGLGGFAGSVSRYLVGLYTLKITSSLFPYATLGVNLAGSLLIGLLAGILIKSTYQPYQLFLLTGFCGGFTTFSTFSLDGVKLLRTELYTYYLVYTATSIIGGLLLCVLGLWVAQKLSS